MFFSFERGDEERPYSRMRTLQKIIIVLFSLYTIRLFSMQVISGEAYRSRAEKIARQTTIIPAQRGEIYDRNYNTPIVLNTDSFAIDLVPADVPKGTISDLLDRLSQTLGIPKSQLEKKVPSNLYRSYQPLELAANIPYEMICKLAEHVDQLPGVSWQSKPIRNYVDSGSLSHVVGYVGDITKDELKVMYNKGYELGDIIGKSGIEKQYDDVLRGQAGREVRVVDVKGRKMLDDKGNFAVAPIMGKNIVLSIDRRIQTLTEKALGERMGAAIVMRPTTGEVLAMVSYPWYDPNIFNSSSSTSSYQSLLEDPKKPLLNRAIQSSYPPASTFKIIMSAGIIEEKAFPQDKYVTCNGEVSYGDRLFRCHIRKPGHGPLNLKSALAQSCDIYFWTVCRDDLGIERVVSYAKDFGYGDLTKIDIPGEIPGFIPTPQWKERRFHEKWTGGDTMNMSIGQGYTLTTPIQMANMVSMIVNNGTAYVPTLLKEVRDPVSGVILKTVSPTVLKKSSISLDTFTTVRQNMRSVVSEGTAKFPVNIKSVQIAGKTGTAEVGLVDHWHSWFASYAPYETDKPEERIVVVVIVEASNPWEWWATYASTIIYQGYFANQTFDESIKALGLQYLAPQRERRE